MCMTFCLIVLSWREVCRSNYVAENLAWILLPLSWMSSFTISLTHRDSLQKQNKILSHSHRHSHNVFHSCLSAAGVRVILYDEESVREEEQGERVGKGGGVNLGSHHHWSRIPLHQLLKVFFAWMCTFKHTRKSLCIMLVPTPCSGLHFSMIMCYRVMRVCFWLQRERERERGSPIDW